MNKKTQEMNVVTKISEIIERIGINFATGIPCGVLREFIQAVTLNPRILHIPALNEREAVGLAAGAYLGGKIPLLYMQNSGFFVSSNDYASILALMKIPALSIISHRGCEGEDSTQHLLTGKHTTALLNGLEIFYNEIINDDLEQAFLVAAQHAKRTSMPTVVLIKRSRIQSLTDSNAKHTTENMSIRPIPMGSVHELMTESVNIDRDTAIDCIVSIASSLREARLPAIISTTGIISRSLFERYDNSNLMYNPGGFGQTSAIGYGFALAKPRTRTIVIDGDASVLADLGNIVLIGAHTPKRLIHIIIDNEAYGSCSEEQSLSFIVNLPTMAAVSGYRNVFRVDTLERLRSSLIKCLILDGPNMIIAKVKLGGRRDFARPLDMGLISGRFRNYFTSQSALV